MKAAQFIVRLNLVAACLALVWCVIGGMGWPVVAALAVLTVAGLVIYGLDVNLARAQLADSMTAAKADQALARLAELSTELESMKGQVQRLMNRPGSSPAPEPANLPKPFKRI